MRRTWNKLVASMLMLAMVTTMSGCSSKKNKSGASSKPSATAKKTEAAVSATPKATPSGKSKASGKGNKTSDIPLVVGYKSFEKKFNPFVKLSSSNEDAVALTQLKLFTVDREGAIVRKGIEGMTRSYNGEDYDYKGPADVVTKYDVHKDETVYTITLGENIKFSDGSLVTIDDVIFSLYAYCDSDYKGSQTIGKQNIIGITKYHKNKKTKSISGINRISDYKMTVTTKGYNRDTLTALAFPVCSLKFYGNVKKYSYEKNKFGFTKGDISSLIKNKNYPMGAGSYKFVKSESGILYYEANDLYYLGCPKIAFLQLKATGSMSEEKKTESLAEEEVDILSMQGTATAIEQICETNSNKKLNGGDISTRMMDADNYAFVGFNAKKVSVSGKEGSSRSKYLRKALATVINSGRKKMIQYDFNSAVNAVDYPSSYTSWLTPETSSDNYVSYFETNEAGEDLYESDMTLEERWQKATEEALKYLKKAGYTIKSNKVVAAPKGGATSFRIMLPYNSQDYAELKDFAGNAQTALKSIGIKLKVDTSKTTKQVEQMVKKGKQQIWFSYMPTKPVTDVMSYYHSKTKGNGKQNHFGISDTNLDDYIDQAVHTPTRTKSKKLFKKIYKSVLNWGVELPLYQHRDFYIMSSARITMETVPENLTKYYDWKDEIQNLEMR